MVIQTFNPSTQQAEAGVGGLFMDLRLAWSIFITEFWDSQGYTAERGGRRERI